MLTAAEVPFDSERWHTEAQASRVEEHLGRTSLYHEPNKCMNKSFYILSECQFSQERIRALLFVEFIPDCNPVGIREDKNPLSIRQTANNELARPTHYLGKFNRDNSGAIFNGLRFHVSRTYDPLISVS